MWFLCFSDSTISSSSVSSTSSTHEGLSCCHLSILDESDPKRASKLVQEANAILYELSTGLVSCEQLNQTDPQSIRESIRISPSKTSPYGDANLKKCMKLYEDALRLDPTNTDAAYNIAVLLHSIDHKIEAEKYYRQCVILREVILIYKFTNWKLKTSHPVLNL